MPEPTDKPRPVKITSVSYGMTVALPAFENAKFNLTAEVAPDENWREVLEALRQRSWKLRQRILDEGA